MISHEAARGAIIVAFQDVIRRPPTRNEAQIAQAIALYESRYGDAAFVNRETGERITGTNNWGAVHCNHSPPCSEGCFEATDTRADGTPYQTCFRRFVSPSDGAKFFIRTLYVGGTAGGPYDRRKLLAAAGAGDIRRVAQFLNETKYSEAPIVKLENALVTNLQIVSKALDEPMPAKKGSGRWPLLVGLTVAGIAGYYLWGMFSRSESAPSSETTSSP